MLLIIDKLLSHILWKEPVIQGKVLGTWKKEFRLTPIYKYFKTTWLWHPILGSKIVSFTKLRWQFNSLIFRYTTLLRKKQQTFQLKRPWETILRLARRRRSIVCGQCIVEKFNSKKNPVATMYTILHLVIIQVKTVIITVLV